MKQNVFMASMYFFYPLEKVVTWYEKVYRGREWTTIEPPPYIKCQESMCEFTPFDFGQDNNFYFPSYAMQGNKRLIRRIELKCFLLRYYSNAKSKKHNYLFIVGASVDKFLTACQEKKDETLLDLCCTKNDLIYLKRAFYENGTRGFFPTDRHSQRGFHEWLDNTISEITGTEHQGVMLQYSVVDVIGIDIDKQCFSRIDNVNAEFNKQYYSPTSPSYKQALSGNCERFAYGLLFGNDNYKRVPSNEYDDVLKQGYSNNITEITYAANSTILLLHTHHSYLFGPKNLNRTKKLDPRLCGAQNVVEMCDVIYTKRKMQYFNEQLRHSNASLIKETLLSISRFVNSDLFNMSELDRKMDYIYSGLGIYKEYELLVKTGDLASSSEEIKAGQRTNTILIILSILAIIVALLQLL